MKKISKSDQALFLVQMALEIFSLHTKLHGPVTASPPTNRHHYPLILNDDDRNNHPAHLAVPVWCPPAPSRCGVRRPRAADHPSPCPHATRPSPLRPRLSSAGRRPSAGVQVSPGATGPGIWSVCTIYFLNNSVLTPISLPLSQIYAANIGTGARASQGGWDHYVFNSQRA